MPMKELESDLETVSLWSSNNSSVFSDDKTKLISFSTTQLSQRHNLNNSELSDLETVTTVFK